MPKEKSVILLAIDASGDKNGSAADRRPREMTFGRVHGAVAAAQTFAPSALVSMGELDLLQTFDDAQLELFLDRCDVILDARSPAEYEEDHLPGAFNTPVLDNGQRAEIGTLFKRNPFEARKRGARYALDNIRDFLESPACRAWPEGTAIMVYCARGGQRSGALATVLSEIGFPVFRPTRGYKSYRAYVQQVLERPLPGPVWVLHGFTGSRKTALLHRLADRCNIVDLEGAARHRGSVFGEMPDGQPGQRPFESKLVRAIRAFDPAKPTLIEGESRRIGRLNVPNPLWHQMVEGRNLWLQMSRARRVTNILEDYADHKLAETCLTILPRLASYVAKRDIATMHAQLESGDWAAFVDLLLEKHYDPLYGRFLRHHDARRIEADDDEAAYRQLVELIEAG
ncbi:tRNA 2-selenouridine(34) synthase MnmH [Sulfidibacter corallicola]